MGPILLQLDVMRTVLRLPVGAVFGPRLAFLANLAFKEAFQHHRGVKTTACERHVGRFRKTARRKD